MKRLDVHGLTKTLGGVRALRNARLTVGSGEIHALLGEHGAGKSTLAKILAGIVQADTGVIHLDGVPVALSSPAAARRAGIAFIPQDRTLAPDLTVEENLMLGMEPSRFGLINNTRERAAARRSLAELRCDDIPLDLPAGLLTESQRQRVEIARALASDPRLLVMDEPISALSRLEIQAVYSAMCKLAAQGAAILFVGNSFQVARELCHRYTILREGRTVAIGATKHLDPADAVELMSGRKPALAFPRIAHHLGRPLLNVRALAGRKASAGIDLVVREGEIFGLAGLVGAGRSRFLHTICGVERVANGEVRLNGADLTHAGAATRHDAGIAMLGKLPVDLFFNRGVVDNLALPHLNDFARLGFLSKERLRLSTRDWMEKLKVWQGGPSQEVAGLSRPNQCKIAFGRLLQSRSRVILLDDPTAGVDEKTRMEIYIWIGEMASEGRAILIAGSNPRELIGICDTVGVMREGRVIATRPALEWTEAELIETSTAI